MPNKTSYHAHRRRLHIHRFSWFAFMLSGLLLVQVVYNFQISGGHSVLAYATNVNRTDLHAQTNAFRSAAGLGSLALDSQLNQAAQAKAEHMITNDYWAHVAPDGTTPWYFFESVGYVYVNAGENLAYGFRTSAEVVQAWMDSPSHRDNVLGNYQDVGFGYMDGANYQGGQYTVVVAMYGTRQAPAVTQPVQPQPEQPITNVQPAQNEPVEPAEPVAETPAAPASPAQEQAEDTDPVTTPTKLTSDDNKAVSAGSLAGPTLQSWPFYASLVVIAISSIGFSVTHLRLLRLSWNEGLRFALHHPLIDTAIISSVVIFTVTATVGFIQ